MLLQKLPDRAPDEFAPVVVQITVYGNDNEVHVDGSAIAEAVSHQGRGSLREVLERLLGWCQQLVELVRRRNSLLGGAIAVVTIALSLLGFR
jgi:hypothetical protein